MNELENLKPEHRAAQLWCLPAFSSRTMDPEFCTAIANAIREAEGRAMYDAWAVIANAGVNLGDWKTMHPEWVKAAETWREGFHAKLREVRESSE